jgi:hypothetical protein
LIWIKKFPNGPKLVNRDQSHGTVGLTYAPFAGGSPRTFHENVAPDPEGAVAPRFETVICVELIPVTYRYGEVVGIVLASVGIISTS